eukprot:Sdes_comp14928_c0_seq1m3624
MIARGHHIIGKVLIDGGHANDAIDGFEAGLRVFLEEGGEVDGTVVVILLGEESGRDEESSAVKVLQNEDQHLKRDPEKEEKNERVILRNNVGRWAREEIEGDKEFGERCADQEGVVDGFCNVCEGVEDDLGDPEGVEEEEKHGGEGEEDKEEGDSGNEDQVDFRVGEEEKYPRMRLRLLRSFDDHQILQFDAGKEEKFEEGSKQKNARNSFVRKRSSHVQNAEKRVEKRQHDDKKRRYARRAIPSQSVLNLQVKEADFEESDQGKEKDVVVNSLEIVFEFLGACKHGKIYRFAVFLVVFCISKNESVQNSIRHRFVQLRIGSDRIYFGLRGCFLKSFLKLEKEGNIHGKLLCIKGLRGKKQGPACENFVHQSGKILLGHVFVPKFH